MFGEIAAQAVQLGIEYDPDPPHDSGSVHKAPPEVVDAVRSVMETGDAEVAERLGIS
jgi:hypothetical protein